MNDVPQAKRLQQEESELAYEHFIVNGGKPKVYDNFNNLISGGKDDRPKKSHLLSDGRKKGFTKAQKLRNGLGLGDGKHV